MKKGTKVIYNNELYTVWKKDHNFVTIYKPEAKLPELTMVSIGIKHVKKA